MEQSETLGGDESSIRSDESQSPTQGTSIQVRSGGVDTKSLLPLLGIIVIDGNGASFATLRGTSSVLLEQFKVTLPKRYGRGGNSSVRFARLRIEKKTNYLIKVCSIAASHFLHEGMCHVSGIVLAGSDNFKNELQHLLDPQLMRNVITIVDLDGAVGKKVQEAIKLCQDALKSAKEVKEQELIDSVFDEIKLQSGMVVYGREESLKSLQAGQVKKLICSECNRQFNAAIVHSQCLWSELKLLQNSEQLNRSATALNEGEIWLANQCIRFATELEMVDAKSGQGIAFLTELGGLAGLLHPECFYSGDFKEPTASDDSF